MLHITDTISIKPKFELGIIVMIARALGNWAIGT